MYILDIKSRRLVLGFYSIKKQHPSLETMFEDMNREAG